jgi:hypothetical protein
MRPIPPALRQELAKRKDMQVCMICLKRPVEWHHAITGLGRKQLNEWWAIVASCYDHHRGNEKNDERWRHIAYQRAEEKDFMKYPKMYDAWVQEKEYLKRKYGIEI